MAVALSSSAARMRFDHLVSKHEGNREAADIRRVQDAFETAVRMYGDSRHWAGESVIDHCLGVLEMFLAFNPDDNAVIACLLHHVLDTKAMSLDEMEKMYGAEVRSIVSGVHLLSHVTTENRRMSMENLRLMFLRISDDIHVVLLILCDQNYLLGRMDAMTQEQSKNLCRDVLQLFAPVAARLGIYSLKHKMESQAFPVSYPVDGNRIGEQLQQIHDKHGHFLPHAATLLTQFLKSEGVNAQVQAREKHPYSIFLKMKNRTVTHVEDVYDLFALRVIVESDIACYQTLGLIHRIGHPVSQRFKDYIAFPKPNGYKSLHTTLAQLPGVPDSLFVEVQIRTEYMQREAEFGIAAHWSYKEGGSATQAMRKAQLQQALMLQQPIESTRALSLSDHIFVLTPQGDIIELPEGATPLDFAFHVHTALGLSFRAARVNGHIVPLNQPLENGDVVEIQKHATPRPSPRWLTLLKTASAKARLKRFLVTTDRPLYLQMGREAFNRELAKHHLPPLDTDLSVLRKFDGEKMDLAEREEMLIKVGQAAQNAASMLQHLDIIKAKLNAAPAPLSAVHTVSSKLHVEVEGNIPMPVRFAKCCKPDFAKKKHIIGVVGRTGDVRVHYNDCKMLRKGNPERRVKVRWVVKGKK